MKAIILNEFNGPLILADLPKPVINERQVLVRIIASGLNPLDLKIRAGKADHAKPVLPALVMGIDMAGVVEQVGKAVSTFTPGDQVYGMVGGIAGLQGTLAEYITVDPDLLARKPVGLSWMEAAAMPLTTITAWEALIERAAVKKQDRVLIHGGAGGVGSIAIQIARATGAEVFATCSAESAGIVGNLGATPIDYRKSTADTYVDAYTNGDGFDVVLDTIGGKVLDESFLLVKRYTGRVVSILGWGSHSLAPLSFRGASYSGVFTLYPLISGKDRANHGKILSDAALLANSGRLKPMLAQDNFTLGNIEDAFLLAGSGKPGGKVVISVFQE